MYEDFEMLGKVTSITLIVAVANCPDLHIVKSKFEKTSQFVLTWELIHLTFVRHVLVNCNLNADQ